MPVPSDHIINYTFDNITGNTVNDEDGNTDGTISGTTIISADTLEGDSAHFDGLVGDIRLSNPIVASVFGVSFWFKILAAPAAPSMAFTQHGAVGYRGVYFTTTNIIFISRQSGGASISATAPADVYYDDEWHNAVISESAGELELWVDGFSVATAVMPTHYESWSTDSAIGVRRANNDLHFTGEIDQFYLFDRALNESDVTAFYSEFRSQVPTDFIAHYTMDNIVGATLVDETGTYDGTIVGTATQVPGVIDDGINLDFGENFVTNDAIAPFVSSISAWFRVSTIGTTSPTFVRPIYSNRGAGTGFTLWAGNIAGGFNVTFANRDSTTTVTPLTPLPTVYNLNQIYHVALSISDTEVKVYVDSILEYHALLNTPYVLTTNESVIGKELLAPYRFDGMIDQFRIYDRPLNQSEVNTLYTEGSLLLDLRTHYTMDNISVGTLVDETSNGNDSTIVGATQVSGYLNDALHFDSLLSQKVDSTTMLPEASTFSLSLWVKFPINPATTQVIISQNKNLISQSKYRGFFVISSGEFKFLSRSSDGSSNVQISLGVLATSTWYHLVLIQDDVDCSAYLNGVLQGSDTLIDTSDFLGAQRIGCRNGAGGDDLFFDGDIDQLRVYDKALASAEVHALYIEGIVDRFLTGTITETLGVTNWHVRAYRLDNGILTASVDTTDGTFNLTIGLIDHVPHLITCLPEQGTPWSGGETLIINELRYPTDPATTPYYYKVTIAGDTGSTEPIWVTVPGQTVVDGTVTFECIERMVQPITHSPLIPQ